MTNLQFRLMRACERLDLRCKVDMEVPLSSGKSIVAEAVIESKDGQQKTIIVDSYSTISDCIQELISEGYGYSVLSPPRLPQDYSVEACESIFREWGMIN